MIFPFSDIERHGIEDLRLVQFTDDDGTQTYYGTFTAYNGVRVFPQLLEYRGGSTIDVRLITGECAKNKGMALFPRRIRGKYAMISRIDNENLYYMESDDVLALGRGAGCSRCRNSPGRSIQIGNCGSPLETDEGWLLMTHGVGPMRQYCIGATLLDRDDPWRVLGQTREPLLMPNDEERSSGYVPNVVYSCGAMIHNRKLIVPYAISDLTTLGPDRPGRAAGLARTDAGRSCADNGVDPPARSVVDESRRPGWPPWSRRSTIGSRSNRRRRRSAGSSTSRPEPIGEGVEGRSPGALADPTKPAR